MSALEQADRLAVTDDGRWFAIVPVGTDHRASLVGGMVAGSTVAWMLAERVTGDHWLPTGLDGVARAAHLAIAEATIAARQRRLHGPHTGPR